jgi:hypothetical protein
MLRFISSVLLALVLFAVASAASAAPVTPPPTHYQVFLPQLSTAQAARISFGTGMREDSDLLTGVADSFTYGLDLLYVQVDMQGVADQAFQLDLVFPDGERIEGRPYTPYTPDFLETRAYCLSLFSCWGGREPLPEGVYTAELFLNGRLWQTARATIR